MQTSYIDIQIHKSHHRIFWYWKIRQTLSLKIIVFSNLCYQVYMIHEIYEDELFSFFKLIM